MLKLPCFLVPVLAGLLSAGAASADPANVRPAAAAQPAKPTPSVSCGPDALGTARTLAVGAQGGLEVGFKTYPRSLPLADHEVVLTFDDGPGATTPAVLAALAHECVKATFFLIGRNAEARPDLVKRELAEGHTLGHHSYSHPARTLRRMDEAAAEADIERGFKADDMAAYGVAGDSPKVPFFRFPGFADSPPLDAWLAKRNIANFGTDLWALDWLMLTPKAELDYLLRRLDKTKRGIILLHDIRASTAAMLPDFLRALRAQGYRIVALVPGPGTSATDAAPKGWTSETDRIIAQVFEREADRRAWSHVRRGLKARRHAGLDRGQMRRQYAGHSGGRAFASRH
jgi:peptidoglycan/xylan/chitin deacetylase (PgdA/CDA1 family)